MGWGYCTKCGAKMIYRRRSKGVKMYNPINGEALYLAENVCPNKLHWLDGHTRDRGIEGPMLLPEGAFDE